MLLCIRSAEDQSGQRVLCPNEELLPEAPQTRVNRFHPIDDHRADGQQLNREQRMLAGRASQWAAAVPKSRQARPRRV